MRSIRRARWKAGSAAERRGRHSVSKRGLSSFGGPGSRMTILRKAPSGVVQMVSRYWPGALPLALGSRCAPSRTSAWRTLLGGIGMRRAVNRARRLVSSTGSRCSGTFRASARHSRVRSSSVGPRPPERMTMSARPSAMRIAAVRCLRLSPTMVLKATETPRSLRPAVR